MSNRSATTLRVLASQAVVNTATALGEPRFAVWQRIYTRLELLHGVNLHNLPRKSGESLLSVAERYGCMDKVYCLAYAEYIYQRDFEE